MGALMRRILQCLLLLFSVSAVGQDTPPVQPRQKVALVLEGGSALGLAHIGVLQWIEEHHIPVDYVAGTSMGGLIGGAYATGMRPAAVRELVTGIDWDAVLRGRTEFEDLSFRRKEDRRAYPNSLEFGLRKGVTFPAGFNSGQQVDLILDKIALPYSTVKSFDDLPIPFRCIATDLVSRDMHVFKDGSLSEALRSTMSLPGFFTPVKSGGKIYVDGGLLDNLPTDVAKDMGPDVTIAVHLETAPVSPDALMSSFSVLAQSFSVVIAANERRGMELADFLVRVDLTKFSGTDYNKSDQLIAAGYKAAQQSASALLKLAVDDAAWKEYLSAREARRIRTVPVPTFIEVTGTTPQLAQPVKHDLQDNEGRPINEAELGQELTIQTGKGRFASVGYGITEMDRRFGLRISAVEKEYAPPFVSPGLFIDGSQYNNVRFSVGGRLTMMDVGKPGAEFRTNVTVGSTYQIASQYFRPVSDSTHWFMQPHASASSSPIDIYSRNTEIAQYRYSQANVGFDTGYMFDRFSQFQFGYQVGWQNYTPDIGNPNILPSVSGREGVSSAQYLTDHLDSPIVPRKGYEIASEFDFYDSRPAAQDQFPALQLSVKFFKPVRKPDSVFLTASGGTTFGYSQTGVPLYTLGGPLRLSAYGTNEIFTNQYMLYQLGYLHQLAQLSPILGNKIYFTTFYELAKPYGTRNGISSLPMDGTAGIVIESLVGPILFAGSWGDSGHRKIFFTLGRIF